MVKNYKRGTGQGNLVIVDGAQSNNITHFTSPLIVR